MSEYQLRIEVAALSTRILNRKRAIRRGRDWGMPREALAADERGLGRLLIIRGFKEALLNRTVHRQRLPDKERGAL